MSDESPRPDTQARPDVVLDGSWEFALTDSAIDVGDDPWRVFAAEGIRLYPAEVPGNLEIDLQRVGLIEDPFVGMRIAEIRNLERSFCYYVRTFLAPLRGASTPVLIFGGLDCDARVFLNGRLVAETHNMLVEHVIPVGDALLDGAQNLLAVEFAPVVDRAERSAARGGPGLLAEGGSYAALFVRKAAHMYGWDIMPRALSLGIWRSACLRFLEPTRIETVWLDTEGIAEDGREAQLALHFDVRARLDILDVWDLQVVGVGSMGRFEHSERLLFGTGLARFSCSAPQLWWPRGRGEAHLYEVTVSILCNSRLVDTRSFQFGIRTIALDRTSVTDADGNGRFRFIVNDEPVFILGTNWGPLDAYHSRDRERMPRALALVTDLGCNMIRCWGGNVYESDEFYATCDAAGILVWQDFAMACAIYPQDASFQREIEDEARHVVRRLRQHACVALWAGDNECDEQYVWKGRRRNPNNNVLTRTVIPKVLEAEDGSRPYLPSSPFVDEIAYDSNARLLPEDHLWGPRDYYKSAFYLDPPAHFASEIGYHGCPDAASVRRFISPDRVWPASDNPEWLLHSTSPYPGVDTHDYRVELMFTQVRALFGTAPETLERFVFASQATQAEALKFFIETFRVGKWRRTGIVWWSLIDGWPQFSDAVVDYYFQPKLAYETIKRAQAPISLILKEPQAGKQDLVLSNDTRTDVPVSFAVHDVRSGELTLEGTCLARADAVSPAGNIPTPAEQTMYSLTWSSQRGRARSHYLAGTPPFSLNHYTEWMQRARVLPPEGAP